MNIEELKELANKLSGCTPEELSIVVSYLEAHEENNHKVGITSFGDPVPPDPTKPPHP